jgi:thioredoxin:protein disulfide reductase
MAKNITFFILIFVSILFPLTLHAQFGFQGSSSGDKVSTSVFLSVDNVHPGAEFYIAIRLDIDDEWHINAHVPTFDYLIGTRLNLEETDVFELTGMTYPSSKKYRFAFADDELDVYEGRIYIYLKARTSRDLEPAEYTIPGTLTVQACDDQICLAPSDIAIDVPVRVAGLETPAGLINREIFTDEVTESIGALSVRTGSG